MACRCRLAVAAAVLVLSSGCKGPVAPCTEELTPGTVEADPHNVVLILLDDVGMDRMAAYGEHPEPAYTPTLDGLADEGILFRNAYVDPTCSPTRATLLTGRRPSRHGVGSWIFPSSDTGLPHEEVTIPEMLREAPDDWSSALIGKWHLSGDDDPAKGRAPLVQGFDTHRGTFANPRDARFDAPLGRNYWHYEYFVDGEASMESEYLTTRTTDDAIDQLQTLKPPFYLHVAYNAAHEPWHVPPRRLLGSDPPSDPDRMDQLDLMIEALDTEIGRLLDHIDLTTTTVVVLSDNGTKETLIRPPWNVRGSKGTLYESGVRVPMWVLGRAVRAPGTESEAMVYAADLFPTLAEIAGVDITEFEEPIDGVSLLPLLAEPEQNWRACLVTEAFPVNGQPSHRRRLAVRDATHKLIEHHDEADELFEVGLGDQVDSPELFSASRKDEELRAVRRQLHRWLARSR